MNVYFCFISERPVTGSMEDFEIKKKRAQRVTAKRWEKCSPKDKKSAPLIKRVRPVLSRVPKVSSSSFDIFLKPQGEVMGFFSCVERSPARGRDD